MDFIMSTGKHKWLILYFFSNQALFSYRQLCLESECARIHFMFVRKQIYVQPPDTNKSQSYWISTESSWTLVRWLCEYCQVCFLLAKIRLALLISGILCDSLMTASPMLYMLLWEVENEVDVSSGSTSTYYDRHCPIFTRSIQKSVRLLHRSDRILSIKPP